MTSTPTAVTFLGTGTSQGVPVIGCDCPVCTSNDPRDKRLRCSLLLEFGDKQLVIDTGPDFRQQMLRHTPNNLRAILLTHEHNDHIIGLDDVRPFNFSQWRDMPVYSTDRILNEVRRRFHYIFAAKKYPGAPMIQLQSIETDPIFSVEDIQIQPLVVLHGQLPVLGFRFGDFTYITDMKTIEPKEKDKIMGTKILVINALHHKPHNTHLNLEEALAFAEEIGADSTYFIHCSHRMGLYADIEKEVPEGIYFAYDGLRLEQF